MAEKDSDPLLSREFVPVEGSNEPGEVAGLIFTLVTYNILDESHSVPSAAWYPQLSVENLTNMGRNKRFMKELEYLNGDVVCLQEVGEQYFADKLTPDMKALGYEGVFFKRASETYQQGEATFWRESRFKLLQSKSLVLSESACAGDARPTEHEASIQAAIAGAAVAVVTQLQCMTTGNRINVANIHVMYYDVNSPRPDLQCIQVACALRQVASIAPGDAVILCGDFNSSPGTPMYQVIPDGRPNDQSMRVLQELNAITLPDGTNTSLVQIWGKGFEHTSKSLKSAYHTVFGQEPITTRYPSDGRIQNVDFIWYSSDSLRLIGALKTAPEKLIKDGIPNHVFPSDHLSLKVSLAFK